MEAASHANSDDRYMSDPVVVGAAVAWTAATGLLVAAWRLWERRRFRGVPLFYADEVGKRRTLAVASVRSRVGRGA